MSHRVSLGARIAAIAVLAASSAHANNIDGAWSPVIPWPLISNNNTNLFSYEANTLTRGNNLNRARWYSSSTVLLNGEIYTQGGSGGTDFPEVRDTSGQFRLLGGANTSSLQFQYPRNFIAPDGRIFGFDASGRMYYVNPTGTGAIALGEQLPAGVRSSSSSAAMFRPGRILQFGGASTIRLICSMRPVRALCVRRW